MPSPDLGSDERSDDQEDNERAERVDMPDIAYKTPDLMPDDDMDKQAS
jgi:hypothetical protein